MDPEARQDLEVIQSDTAEERYRAGLCPGVHKCEQVADSSAEPQTGGKELQHLLLAMTHQGQHTLKSWSGANQQLLLSKSPWKGLAFDWGGGEGRLEEE